MVSANPLSKCLLFFIMSCFLVISLSSCAGTSGLSPNIDTYKPVIAASVKTGAIQNVTTFTGMVRANQEAYVSAPFPGKVSDAFFEVGDWVNEGEVLFILSPDEIQDSIAILEEQLKVAHANVSLAENGVAAAWGSQYESQKIQLESTLKSAEKNYIALKASYDEYLRLYEQKKVTRQQFMEIKTRFEQASIALNSAIDAYDLYINRLSKDNIDIADDQLIQAHASYDVIRYQLESARKKLDQTRVTAPISGVIGSKQIMTGAMTSPEMPSYVILDQSSVLVMITVTEQVINLLQKGDPVSVEIPSARSKPYTGKIHFISPSVDNTTMAYTVGIKIDNPEGLIKPGMTARAGIRTEKRDNALIIPLSSVLTGDGESYVFTIKSGKAVKRVISTGLSDDEHVEVTSGLNPGEILIIKGHQYLKDQDTIRVIKEEAEQE
jgi:HlyD family secretion protein